MKSPRFEVVTTTAGAVSIRNLELNEIMHNPVGPWAEANALYIDQSALKQRLSEPLHDELVVFDVGLGAAANALAVLHCAQSVPNRTRGLRLVSFERDLELLEFALENAGQFEHFRGFEDPMKQLLETGQWSSAGIHWSLHRGDFLKQVALEPARPHIVYYDPYSQKVDRGLWTEAAFRVLRQYSREAGDGGTLILTYSQSTPIRSGLLSAGFFVGRGIPTGFKEETTQAATRLEDLHSPLGEEWLGRWKRSHTKHPFDCLPGDQPRLEQVILGHPQFASL